MKKVIAVAFAFAVSFAIAGQAQALDHMKCYKVKKETAPFPPIVNVLDQFGPIIAEVKKPFLWCNPAIVDGSPVAAPTDHLLCYKIKADKQEIALSTTNQFGVSTIVAKKAFLVCVPGSKTLL